jgi:hypothetical protein
MSPMLRRIFQITAVILALIGAIAAIGFYWLAQRDIQTETSLGPKLMAELGFTVSTPLVRADGQTVEVLALHPKQFSVLREAGVRDADIVVGVRSVSDFYRHLDEYRRKAVKFRVVPGGDGRPFGLRKHRTITIGPT